MSSQKNGSGGLMRINVTPIIDVALTLVIILLLTAPMLSVPNLNLNLPQAHARGNEDTRAVTITLDREGHVAVDDKMVTDAEFASVLHDHMASKARLQDIGDVRVVLRADAGLSYGRVSALLDQARAAGAQRVAVATRQEGTAVAPAVLEKEGS